MTTNQTIDGVPREAVAALEKARDVLRAIIRDQAGGVHYASAQAACHQINGTLDELRALLDAPVCGTPSGDQCPGDGVGRCKKCPAAQAQGEPVAMSREEFEAWVLVREHPTYGWIDKHWLARGDDPETYADPYVQGLWVASKSFYAERPAPVAVARMCDCNQGRLPCTCKPSTYDGFNNGVD